VSKRFILGVAVLVVSGLLAGCSSSPDNVTNTPKGGEKAPPPQKLKRPGEGSGGSAEQQ
jgi:hypothetical protein